MYQVSRDYISVACSDLSKLNWIEKSDVAIAPANVVHVWVGDISSTGEDEMVLLRNRLSFDALTKSDRYRSEDDSKRYLVTQGMLQQIIYKYTGRKKVAITYTKYGKPFIPSLPNLSYNISHSGKYVLIAFRFDGLPIGVDIEQYKQNPNLDLKQIVEEYYHPREQAALGKEIDPRLFYKLWTRKEAFLKVTELGLTEEMRELNVLGGRYKFYGSGVFNEFNKKSFEIKSFKLQSNYYGSLASGEPVNSYFFVSF